MQIRLFIITLFAVCFFTGCPKDTNPDGFPPLYPCEITITQGGQPLAGAKLRLVPESGAFQWNIDGSTNANGVATITTHTSKPGAPAGTYKVLVSKTAMSPSKYPDPPAGASKQEIEEHRQLVMSEQGRKMIQYVDPKYGEVSQTPHSISIVKGKNRGSFDVGDAVSIELK